MDLSQYKPGTVLFASEYCEEVIEEARDYIKKNSLDKSKIKIAQRKNINPPKKDIDMVVIYTL